MYTSIIKWLFWTLDMSGICDKTNQKRSHFQEYKTKENPINQALQVSHLEDMSTMLNLLFPFKEYLVRYSKCYIQCSTLYYTMPCSTAYWEYVIMFMYYI